MIDRTPLTLRTILLAGSSLILLCGALWYVAFQARFIITGPQITLEQHTTGRQNVRTATLSGNAQNITRLWLNDRQIFTDQTGYFTEALVLENGYTVATVKAEDRYGRVTSVTREYVYIPASFIQ